jgi:recombination protein RecT
MAVSDKPAAKKQDLAHLLTSPQTLAQIKAALPRHMTAERMARVALTEVRKTPALAQCDVRTFIGAVIQLSQLGLEPGGALGHAYLIPFENRSKKTTDVQLIIGYRGMIDLARRSGQIQSLQAVVVREGDKFDVQMGLMPSLVHVPAFDDDKAMTFVYAVAVFKDGGRQFEVMTRGQVERVRKQSRAGNAGPWVTHFEEMAKKTVIRRLFKYLPVSIELQTAVALDERGDAGLSQMLDDVGAIDGSATEVPEDGGSAQLEHREEAEGTVDTETGELFAGAVTYAQAMAAINACTSDEQCDVAEDLLPGIRDEGQRAECDVALRAKRKALAK